MSVIHTYKKGVVSSGHKLTSQTAADILDVGGNAFDAAVAAAFTSCVVEPVLSSMAGGGFLMAYKPNHKPLLYDFFVQTPSKKPDPNSMDFVPLNADFGGVLQEFHVGLASAAVPGQTAGLFEIHEDLGRIPMKELAQPAIELAKQGFAITKFQAQLFQIVKEIFLYGEKSKAVFGSEKHEGDLVHEGETVKQPDLAGALDALVHEGLDLFYRGEIAQALLSDMNDGGLITAEDLKRYEVIRRNPLQVAIGKAVIFMNSAPSIGGNLIGFGLEVLKQYGVLDKERAVIRALYETLDATTQARKVIEDSLEQGIDPPLIYNSDFIQQYLNTSARHKAATRGTTHISVIDKDLNCASMTLTNGESCAYMIPGTGILLNNMLGEEDVNPRGFHNYEPRQRLSSMMCPSVVEWQNEQRLAVLGSGGSNRIRSALLQVMTYMLMQDAPIDVAINHPRIHTERDHLYIEGGFDEEILDMLKALQPNHNIWDDYNMFFGGVHGAEFDGQAFRGAGDPRREGHASVA